MRISLHDFLPALVFWILVIVSCFFTIFAMQRLLDFLFWLLRCL